MPRIQYMSVLSIELYQKNLSRAGIRNRGRWVRSANATSVLSVRFMTSRWRQKNFRSLVAANFVEIFWHRCFLGLAEIRIKKQFWRFLTDFFPNFFGINRFFVLFCFPKPVISIAATLMFCVAMVSDNGKFKPRSRGRTKIWMGDGKRAQAWKNISEFVRALVEGDEQARQFAKLGKFYRQIELWVVDAHPRRLRARKFHQNRDGTSLGLGSNARDKN